MKILQLVAAILAAALAYLIVRAFFLADFWQSFGQVIADPWGQVALADLYLGFLVTGVIIALVERSPVRIIPLLIALFFLGNLLTALWFAVRLPKIVAMTRNFPAQSF